jgi:hypothetical protein
MDELLSLLKNVVNHEVKRARGGENQNHTNAAHAQQQPYGETVPPCSLPARRPGVCRRSAGTQKLEFFVELFPAVFAECHDLTPFLYRSARRAIFARFHLQSGILEPAIPPQASINFERYRATTCSIGAGKTWCGDRMLVLGIGGTAWDSARGLKQPWKTGGKSA